MRINTRFPMAIHILSLLVLAKEEECTSEMIARSVNTNSVVIRRINAMLKKANIIKVRSGVGGAFLNRLPREITLLDIYNAVKSPEDISLFDLHHNPNEKCPVGANIHVALSEPLLEAQMNLEKTLSTYTLFDVANKIAEKNGVVIE